MLFVTNDNERWGSGVGPLTARQFDLNFWELRSALNSIVANPLKPVEITGITSVGRNLTFHMDDGTDIGPVAIPVVEPHWRGDYPGDTALEELDIFRKVGVGLYLVLQNHMAPTDFDKALLVNDNPAYFEMFAFAPFSNFFVDSAVERDIIINISGAWVNRRPKHGFGFSTDGVPTASQVLSRYKSPVAWTVPANFAAYLGLISVAGGTANAAASTVFVVERALAASPNSFSGVGTITIAAGTVTPTFASFGGAPISFAQGDVCRVTAPAVADATFAGLYGSIIGFET